jgi:hypothetical protein
MSLVVAEAAFLEFLAEDISVTVDNDNDNDNDNGEPPQDGEPPFDEPFSESY